MKNGAFNLQTNKETGSSLNVNESKLQSNAVRSAIPAKNGQKGDSGNLHSVKNPIQKRFARKQMEAFENSYRSHEDELRALDIYS